MAELSVRQTTAADATARSASAQPGKSPSLLTAAMTTMGKVRVIKAAELVATQIRNAIVRGEIKPGETLPAELQLTATFGVSRPTIREATRILESEGLIVVRRGSSGGALVRGPDPELPARALGIMLQTKHATLRDVYEARAAIEPPAARLAAEGRANTSRLREQLELEKSLLQDRPRLATAVADFHLIVVEMSGNITLTLIAQALYGVVQRHNSLVYKSVMSEDVTEKSKRNKVGVKSHSRLVELIEAGDAAAAEDHWRRHMSLSGDFWLAGDAGATKIDVLENVSSTGG